MGPDGAQPTNSAIDVGAAGDGWRIGRDFGDADLPDTEGLGYQSVFAFTLLRVHQTRVGRQLRADHAYSALSAGGFTLARNSSTSTRLFSE